jgi:hypothetical protein
MPYREALKRFDSLDPRCVMEITFEVARLRGNPLTEPQRTLRKVLARNADVLVGISNSLRGLYGNSVKPNTSK